MTNFITPSIEKRASELMLAGVEPIQAVKQALIDEMNLIGSLINSSNHLTELGQIAANHLRNKIQVFNKPISPVIIDSKEFASGK